MGCIGSKATDALSQDTSKAPRKAEGKQDSQQGGREEPEKPQNGQHAAQHPTAAAGTQDGHSHVTSDTEAQVRSLSTSSSYSSTPAAAADSDAPPSPDPSSQPSPGDPSAEQRDSKGFLIKQDSTKQSPEAGLSPGVLELGWTAGHEPESDPSPEPSPEPLDTQAAKLRNRQDAEISMSDDEEEEGDCRPSHSAGEGFDMQRWKRFYQWNYRKPDDLLAFFWKRFDPKAWSLYCVSYRHQDALFAPFQGENVIHGVSCRLEAAIQNSNKPLSSSVFGLLHALTDGDAAKLKVVGILIVRGHKPPSALLRVLDEEEWSLVKAEANDPVVREFVSNLIAPRANKSTVEDYHITCTRTI